MQSCASNMHLKMHFRMRLLEAAGAQLQHKSHRDALAQATAEA